MGSPVPRTRLSRSTRIRAVAPQIISPSASKNQTGNSASGLAVERRGPGHRPPFLVEHTVDQEVGQGQVEDPGHLAGVGGQGGTGLEHPHHRGDEGVGRRRGHWSSVPTTETADGSSPTSSHASRRAPATTSSPASSRPPGKATSPRWERRSLDRTVRMTRVSPACSIEGHKHGGGPRRLLTERGHLPSPVLVAGHPAASRGHGGARTRSRPIDRRLGSSSSAHRAGRPARLRAGRGMTCLGVLGSTVGGAIGGLQAMSKRGRTGRIPDIDNACSRR